MIESGRTPVAFRSPIGKYCAATTQYNNDRDGYEKSLRRDGSIPTLGDDDTVGRGRRRLRRRQRIFPDAGSDASSQRNSDNACSGYGRCRQLGSHHHRNRHRVYDVIRTELERNGLDHPLCFHLVVDGDHSRF
jgi:hypothetical protein